MNHPRPTGPAAIAGGAAAAGGLPVTGSSVLTAVIVGILFVVLGTLLIRSARYRRSHQ